MPQVSPPVRVDADRTFERSMEMHQRALTLLPRGVARAQLAEQKPLPLRFSHGEGSHVWDVDGNEYIDYALGTTTLVLGHAHPRVVARVQDVVSRGALFAGSHEEELELAERLVRNVPSADMVSFHNSGSEAVHAALGMARAITGRSRIIKFEGHMNGWIAPMPVNSCFHPPFEGTPVGVPGWAASGDVTVCYWNDLQSVKDAMEDGEPVSAVILEPVPIDGGVLPTDVDFLRGVRELCDASGALLIFDEVLTGFRVGLGGAQEMFGITPDMTTLAKAFASGFPIAALGATREVWEASMEAGVRLGGTNNAHSIAVAAANGAVSTFEDEAARIYPHLDAIGAQLAGGLRDVATRREVPLHTNQIGPVLFLTWGLDRAATTYGEITRSDGAMMTRLEEELVRRGVTTLRGARWFVSAAHTSDDVERTLEIVDVALGAMSS